MENEIINEKILSLWKKYPIDAGQFYPLLFPELKRETILFIGLNPSFSHKRINSINTGTELENIDFLEYCKLTNNQFNPEFLIQMEKNAQKTYPYFTKFKYIAKELGFATWEHIDLFFYRLTSQKDFKKIIQFNKKKGYVLSEFGEEQLRISLEMIKIAKPRVIVVMNAFSSKIINNNPLFKINTERFNELGYDYLELDEERIPIFFSSMVTGQRALDIHSLRRLIFDIKRCLN